MTNAKSKPNSKRGGARPGAGRKPKLPAAAPVASTTEDIATRVLEQIDEVDAWSELISATSPSMVHSYSTSRSDGIVTPISTKEQASLLNIHFNALRYLKDCRDGRPAQAVEVGGKGGGAIPVAIAVSFVNPNAGGS